MMRFLDDVAQRIWRELPILVYGGLGILIGYANAQYWIDGWVVILLLFILGALSGPVAWLTRKVGND